MLKQWLLPPLIAAFIILGIMGAIQSNSENANAADTTVQQLNEAFKQIGQKFAAEDSIHLALLDRIAALEKKAGIKQKDLNAIPKATTTPK